MSRETATTVTCNFNVARNVSSPGQLVVAKGMYNPFLIYGTITHGIPSGTQGGGLGFDFTPYDRRLADLAGFHSGGGEAVKRLVEQINGLLNT